MKKTILIAGAKGMVGTALQLELRKNKKIRLLTPSRKEVDYSDFGQVNKYFYKMKPDYVYILAAKVGGILANSKNHVSFFEENIQIAINLFKAIYKYKVKKTLFLGSSCVYPRHSKQPIKEEYFFKGPLEPTNEGYALAKIASIRLAYFYKRQYGLNIICPMCTNIYGTNDNYNPETSHVMSALIKKFSDAKHNSLKEVVLWGTGRPKREFMHVKDVARGLVFLMNNSNDFLINLGVGYDISIKNLSDYIVKKLNYNGKIVWDKTKPDGMPRKLLSTQKIDKLGFVSKIDIKSGISKTIKEYKNIFINK
jgi:GDP-L-fucose synthase